MSRLFPGSVRGYLLVLVLVLWIPSIGLLINTGLDIRTDAYREAVQEVEKLASDLAREQEQLVTLGRHFIATASQLHEIESRDARPVEALFRNFIADNPQYGALHIEYADGTVWANAFHTDRAVSLADRRFFVNALNTGRFSTGEFVVSRTSGKPLFNFGYPVKDREGRITDVIGLGVDLSYSKQLLKEASLPTGSSFIITDHKGTVLQRGLDSKDSYVGKPDQKDLFARMANGPDIGTFQSAGYNGVERIFAYRKLRIPGERAPYMYVRASVPLETAMSEANRGIVRNLAMITLFLFSGLVLAWVIGKRAIVDRIAQLQRASQQIANGDLTVKVARHVVGGELGELAHTFDIMARSLAEREQALHASEERYRAINIELEERVEERTAQLQSANEALMEENRQRQAAQDEISSLNEDLVRRGNALELANNDLESFSYSVSHDLRAPLRGVDGYVHILVEDAGPSLTAEHREYLEKISRNVRKMGQLIDDLLAFSRLNRQPLTKSTVHPRLLVTEALAALEAERQGRQLDIRIGDLPECQADPSLLRQVYINLLGNALKFSRERLPAIIEIGSHCEGGAIVYYVRDNGAGFDMEHAAKLFGVFERLHAASEFEGTGVGLAIVQRILHRHGGAVWAEGAVGKGASVYFTLQ
jgi:signal transduction histidine kinase